MQTINQILWNQFGASIEMLINVISKCPEDYLYTNKRFYYIAFHSAIFLDYYLTIPPADFVPVLSFHQVPLEERPADAIGDLLPDRQYSQAEILAYLRKSHQKCQQMIGSLASEKWDQRFTEGSDPGDMDFPVLEILLYNLRHTQHHTGQLNMLLRQDLNQHLEWSFRAGDMDSLKI